MDEEIAFDDVVEQFEGSAPKFLDEDYKEQEETLGDQQEEADGQPEDTANEESDTEDDPEDHSGSEPEDDPEFDVTVGAETRKVKSSELKDLYNQREVIAQRSQAVAQQNRVLEAQGLYLAKLYEDRLATARADVERYQKIDLWQAHRNMDPKEFDALRESRQAAEAELAKLDSESADFMARVMETKRQYVREHAKTALVEIQKAIPEWNDEVYNQVRHYAVSQGMDLGTVNEITDPAAIVMMRKAMLFDSTQKKAEGVTKKVAKAPKRVAPKADTKTETNSAKKVIANARASGDIDDVTEAFIAAMRS